MRYVGGGIGHLKNTPPQQVPIDPRSEEMAVEEEDNDDDPYTQDLGIVPQPSLDVIMISDELDITEDDNEDDGEDSDNGDESASGDDGDDKDDDSGCSSDEEDYGYATP